MGIIGGFAGLIRTQDLLLLILPIIQILSIKRKLIFKHVICYLTLVTGFILGFLPQILLWKYFYNTFWYSPYFEVGFSFLKPQFFHVLFNTQNGLFVTTPITFIAAIGLLVKLFYVFGKSKFGIWKLFVNWNLKIGIYFLALFYFLLQLYLISSWNVYTQGGSYSIRMIITTYPLLAFGLAEAIGKVIKKIGERKTMFVISAFAILNFFSILSYLLRF